MKRRRKTESQFKRYMRRTWKNKLCALGMVAFGSLTTWEGDGTVLVFMIILAIPWFFARTNWID